MHSWPAYIFLTQVNMQNNNSTTKEASVDKTSMANIKTKILLTT